ncbi:hypothetical protein XELAEV_180076452mg, partial [Xenopus laevis]
MSWAVLLLSLTSLCT